MHVPAVSSLPESFAAMYNHDCGLAETDYLADNMSQNQSKTAKWFPSIQSSRCCQDLCCPFGQLSHR